MDSRGLAIMERPVDAETLHLIVRAIRADGKVFEIPIIVQGATGEIQLDESVARQKISMAAPLSHALAIALSDSDIQAAKLAAAFNSEA
jgi:large repetitive protein